MKRYATVAEALDFVREQGVVLASARGPAPTLTEVIVGEPIVGSWWGHAHSHHIHTVLEAVKESGDVLVCRLINGKITLVHRRLWPALVRLGKRFTPEQVAQVCEEHTPSGRHAVSMIPFPKWVPAKVAKQAREFDEQEALADFAAWVPTRRKAR
ncbi:MAG: hypothetical protein A3H91_01905 [Gammaproteobacteria bacterium RIFCSPLOWO2_02_FULL_61_13]|nr:MAG: hypothetical protein A3H91_01905 [Gammaproteobacteria bacterium RIFCSPLOWO2_02_FULL_61_13]